VPLPDSSDIDAAVIERLQSDAQLQSLMVDGVYFDPAPPGLKSYVVVSLVIAEDAATFKRREYETLLYLIKCVQLTTSNAQIKQAAARIDELIEDHALTVEGYSWMTSHRVERVRYTEVDDTDSTVRWQHRGGQYRVQMARAAVAAATAKGLSS
jgi:hypothetical protein